MLEIIDMPWDWPVDIASLEAKAFCRWKSEKTGSHIRLPTEAEWHVLRGFVDALMVGIIFGTYSSTFIAAPILLFMDVRKGKIAKDPAEVEISA